MKNKPAKTPLADQRKQALEHYNEASNAIHHRSSFVERAIKSYDPESQQCIKELKKAMESIKHKINLYQLDYKEYKNPHHTLNEIGDIARKASEEK